MSRTRWLRPVLLILAALAFYAGVRQRRDLVDFDVYWRAGERARTAEPLYRPEDGHYQFKYLPAFALVMAPIAGMDAEMAKPVWLAASVVLLALFMRWSVGTLPDPRLPARTLFLLTALVTAKFWVHELALGQTNILMAAMLAAAVIGPLSRRPLAAGLLVGAAVVVKPYAVLFVPWLWLAQGTRAAAAAALAVAVALVAPAAAYGWNGNLTQLAGWWRTVSDTVAPNLLFPENISLASAWAKWIGTGSNASMAAALSGVGLVALVAGVVAMRRRTASPAYLEFGLILLAIPLLSPQGWDYVLLLAIPAMACVIDRWIDLPRSWRAAVVVAFALTSFTVFDLLGRSLYARLMGWSVVTIGALVLAAALARIRWRGLA